jgi:hypothetical protein
MAYLSVLFIDKYTTVTHGISIANISLSSNESICNFRTKGYSNLITYLTRVILSDVNSLDNSNSTTKVAKFRTNVSKFQVGERSLPRNGIVNQSAKYSSGTM